MIEILWASFWLRLLVIVIVIILVSWVLGLCFWEVLGKDCWIRAGVLLVRVSVVYIIEFRFG